MNRRNLLYQIRHIKPSYVIPAYAGIHKGFRGTITGLCKPNLVLYLMTLALITFLITVVSPAFSVNPSLPSLQVHPLPDSLNQWQDPNHSGDYFDQITPSSMGHLVWSQFPIKIYVDRLVNPDENIASERRFKQWTNTVLQTIEEWNHYLPLKVVDTPEEGDILILRSPPPLGSRIDPETGQLIIPRARSAQTRYEFEIKDGILTHQMTLKISPKLSELSVLSASRHELGHALGIWGHSPVKTDALYFSQVRNPPAISARDINTLKKIYQQPTRLGWRINSKQ